jgi:predicted amidohydrolase YtcJ
MPRRVALCALLVLPAAAAGPAGVHADLVLSHAVVHTVDPDRPRADAVAIRGGRIVAVGSDEEISSLIGPETRVLDLGGRTVVPGFYDAHAHLLAMGFARLDVDLAGTRSYGEVVARVAAAVKTHSPGEWIRGRGWHEEKWSVPTPGAVRGFPTHGALSAVSPDNPVVLTRADGHAVLANAKAMALRGVTARTPAPRGGEIIHDGSGRPTGVFVDNAEALVEPEARTMAETRRALETAMDECLGKGVTSLVDAGEGPDILALYREAAAAGKLRIRLYVMAGGLETLRGLSSPEIGLGAGFLTIRAVKLYADGALGSRGAALLEPYADDPGNRGLLVTPRERLLEATRLALEKGFQVATHAIGDRANRVVLDVYEQALAEHPEAKDPRLRIEHAQILDETDIPRFGRLGVLASIQGIHCPSDRPWAPKRLGMARIREGGYVWRKLLASGARLLNGTDAPVEDVSPIANFHATVTRQDAAGQPPAGFDPDQKLTRAEALRTMTLDAAYGSFEEKEKGSITPGKVADLVVLSQDILAVPDDRLLRTEVLATIVAGKVAFESARSARAGATHEVGEQPPAAGNAGGDLAKEDEADVGPGPLPDLRVDEHAALLARIQGERVGRGEEVHVARVARPEELDRPLLHPARPVPGADPIRPREEGMVGSQDPNRCRLVGDPLRGHHRRVGSERARLFRGARRDFSGRHAIEGGTVVLDDQVAARFHPAQEPGMGRAQVAAGLVGANAGDDRGEPGEIAESEVLGR